MLSLSYTKSTTLLDTLNRVDALRTAILTTPLSIQTEQRLLFRSTVQAIHNSLTLAGFPITHEEIIAILKADTRRRLPTGIMVISHHNALKWIRTQWMANTHPITSGDLQVLATVLLSHPSSIDRAFTHYQKELESLITYCSSHKDHPVILSGLLHAYFFSHPMTPTDNGIFARAVSTMILSQYGYTLRGMATHMIDASDKKNYEFAQQSIIKYGQYTQWLEYIASSVETTYKRLQLTIIKDARSDANQDMINSAGSLSKREEEILSLLLSPTATITNRQLQLHFHISPITASRHVKKLSMLGFLYPHGKGRSVYYTKI